MLSLLHHDNLVNLIGYCVDGAERLLVYEYMQLGSLDDHIFAGRSTSACQPVDNENKGSAEDKEVLNNDSIYFCSDIYLSKLSCFGMTALCPVKEDDHVYSRVFGSSEYSSPEYVENGKLTLKHDIYSFGIILLELIRGRRVQDIDNCTSLKGSVSMALQMFKGRKFELFKERLLCLELVDPLIRDQCDTEVLRQILVIVEWCVELNPAMRPSISTVLLALTSLMNWNGRSTSASQLVDNENKGSAEDKDVLNNESIYFCSDIYLSRVGGINQQF